MLLKRFSCSSSRVITLMLAGASVIFCSKPVALTTMLSSVTGEDWAMTPRLLPSRAAARAVRAKGTDMRTPIDAQCNFAAHDNYSQLICFIIRA
ncbi:hypothetical protein D3C77_734620 [compost metagenome]